MWTGWGWGDKSYKWDGDGDSVSRVGWRRELILSPCNSLIGTILNTAYWRGNLNCKNSYKNCHAILKMTVLFIICVLPLINKMMMMMMMTIRLQNAGTIISFVNFNG